MTVTNQVSPAQPPTKDEQLAMARLLRWARLATANELLPNERVAKCYRVRVQEFVDVLLSRKYQRAHYKGLMTCGSVWHCPVCAAKITERRRAELQSVVETAQKQKLYFFMVTFTLQHKIKDRLADLHRYLTDALTKTKSGRWYADFRAEWGIVGDVTNGEITHGADGWHFHKHALYFTARPVGRHDCAALQAAITEQYKKQLEKLGRYASPIYGVDVRVGDSFVAEYIAKYGCEPGEAWSIASEISKSFTKAPRKFQSFTPFQLLDRHREGDELAGKLFQEYAAAMKGTRQLRYSKLLRENLGITDPEISDEEIAALQDDDGFLFAQLTAQQWTKILRSNKPGQVLEVASTGNPEYLQIYLQSL